MNVLPIRAESFLISDRDEIKGGITTEQYDLSVDDDFIETLKNMLI